MHILSLVTDNPSNIRMRMTMEFLNIMIYWTRYWTQPGWNSWPWDLQSDSIPTELWSLVLTYWLPILNRYVYGHPWQKHEQLSCLVIFVWASLIKVWTIILFGHLCMIILDKSMKNYLVWSSLYDHPWQKHEKLSCMVIFVWSSLTKAWKIILYGHLCMIILDKSMKNYLVWSSLYEHPWQKHEKLSCMVIFVWSSLTKAWKIILYGHLCMIIHDKSMENYLVWSSLHDHPW